MFNDEAENTLNFELPVDESDLEDSNFGIDENYETFDDKELEKEEIPIIALETKQAVVDY